MSSSFVVLTFTSSHGGAPFYESLMVGVKVDFLLSTPHELSQQIQVGLRCLFIPLSLPFSHDSLSRGPQRLPLHREIRVMYTSDSSEGMQLYGCKIDT